jgi:tRNA-uridine 2-sulfurtransferase
MAKLVYLMLSGGVDSSVAAAVLKEQGYEVRCVFMQCWSQDQLVQLGLDPNDYACAWDEDAKDAEWVAHKLGLPFEIWDLRTEYFTHVVSYMVNEYKSGKTPNPDVMCNSFIKFGVFSKKAFEQGADFVATGHYARIIESQKYNTKLIARANDTIKDQSYFLARVNKELVNKMLLPIGEFAGKSEVRAKAESLGLITAHKPDSQGICFIGDTPLRELLLKTLGSKPGKIVEYLSKNTKNKNYNFLMSNDEVSMVERKRTEVYDDEQADDDEDVNRKKENFLGNHQGAFMFTIGQRHGLNLSGGPWFVHSIDIDTNTVYVVHDNDSSELESRVLSAQNTNWFVDSTQLPSKILGQIRYRQSAESASIKISETGFNLEFDTPTRAVAKGQTAAIYDGELLLGSGIIE